MEARAPDEIAAIVFLDIAVIVVVARLMGLLFRRLHQPAVIAEILAGLALGPSLLGLLPGNPTEALFPRDVRPFLGVIAGLGLIIFMFIVGLELDVGLIRGKGRTAATISLVSVALPFALGGALALWLHRSHAVVDGGERVKLLPFALFIGAAMSVTAFPVLARILSERGMHRTETGVLALACAAIDDILAWTMLAVVLAVVRSSGALDLVTMLVEALTFIGLMFWLVRPRLRGLVERRKTAGRLTPNIFAVVLVGVLVSSYITDRIGIHAIFGAFLFGAIMPREGAAHLSAEILERIEQVTVLLLLPVFFIATGLNVDIGGLGATGLLELGAVLVVACTGKFLGAAAAARACGVRARRAAAVGVLMNTRGLTELVILNVGLAAGVLDRRLFTVMVLMAIITTVITEPLLRLIYPERMVARDIASAERAALGLSAGYRVMAAVDGPESEHIVDAGVALLGEESSSQLLISRFDPPVRPVEVGAGLTFELAAVAASFEALQDLARRAADQGATAVVSSRFSDDLPRDILAQALSAEADVLVLSASDAELAEGILSAAECAVVLRLDAGGTTGDPGLTATRLDSITKVAVMPGTGDDGLAAVEQAVRISARRRISLSLLEGNDRREQRRVAALVRRLGAAKVPADVVPLAGVAGRTPDTLLIAGWADWRGRQGADRHSRDGFGVVLLVRRAMDDHGERLDKLLAGAAERQNLRVDL